MLVKNCNDIDLNFVFHFVLVSHKQKNKKILIHKFENECICVREKRKENWDQQMQPTNQPSNDPRPLYSKTISNN